MRATRGNITYGGDHDNHDDDGNDDDALATENISNETNLRITYLLADLHMRPRHFQTSIDWMKMGSVQTFYIPLTSKAKILYTHVYRVWLITWYILFIAVDLSFENSDFSLEHRFLSDLQSIVQFLIHVYKNIDLHKHSKFIYKLMTRYESDLLYFAS